MSDKTEPLAAILAEMRREERPYGISPDRLRSYADRIEAAAERERNSHINDIHDALYKATGIPGNAAKMREALEWAAQFVELGVDDDLGADGQNLTTAAEMARAALAAPARNADRFASADEAEREYCRKAFFAGYEDPVIHAAFRWAFDTAEGCDHA